MAMVTMPAWATMKMFAGEFSASATYAVGAWVTYQGEAWKCHTAVSSAGAWTGATNWTKIPLAELLDAIKAAGDDTNGKISTLYTQALSGAVEPLVKAAILSRNPAIDPTDDPASWPNSIRSLRKGAKDYWADGSLVKFIDYWGNTVLSLLPREAANLAALPAIPVEEGYTAVAWDYSLEEVNTAQGRMTVRPRYVATDATLGTKFVVEMTADALSTAPTLTFRGITLASGSASFSVDWGDGTVQTGLTTAASATHTYETAGTYTVTVSNDLSWVQAPSSRYITRAVQWGSKITTARSSYYGCKGLSYGAPWESRITNAGPTWGEGTYYGCSALKQPLPWTSAITSAAGTYYQCIGLTGTIPKWGQAITSTSNTYYQCTGLTGTIPAWGSAIISAYQTYQGCTGLTGTIPQWGQAITDATGCYQNCAGLTGVWDDPNATDNPPTPDDADLMPAHIKTHPSTVSGTSAALRAYFLTSWGGTRAS